MACLHCLHFVNNLFLRETACNSSVCNCDSDFSVLYIYVVVVCAAETQTFQAHIVLWLHVQLWPWLLWPILCARQTSAHAVAGWFQCWWTRPQCLERNLWRWHIQDLWSSCQWKCSCLSQGEANCSQGGVLMNHVFMAFIFMNHILRAYAWDVFSEHRSCNLLQKHQT